MAARECPSSDDGQKRDVRVSQLPADDVDVGLTMGAAGLILTYGTQEQKKKYLDKMCQDIEQVNRAIAEMNITTQQTAGNAENLSTMMSIFKTENDDSPAAKDMVRELSRPVHEPQ